MRKNLVVLAVIALLATPAFARTRTRSVRQIMSPWQAPACTQITGLPFVRFIDPAGVVRASNPEPDGPFFSQVNTTEALTAGATPNVLWAVTYDGDIAQSADAGCTWTIRAAVPEAGGGRVAPRVLARHATRVYVYTPEKIVRLTMGAVETFSLPDYMVNVEVDPADALHLHGIAEGGAVVESRDGAATWSYVGRVSGMKVLSAATNPHSFQHMLAGKDGSMSATFDGGKTWATTGLHDAKVWDIQFSPVDPLVVWVDALANGAGLFRSTDGGHTFMVVDGIPGASRFSDGPLAPHPTNPDLVAASTHGARISGPQGRISSVFEENVKLVAWSPAGTLYYLPVIVQLR